MKKIILCVLAVFLSLTFCPLQSEAATKKEVRKTPTEFLVSKPAQSLLANVLTKRLNEINEIDKSNLKPSEKQELRKEVRSIKQQLNNLGGGVYVSVGAIIIILLLLIILL